MKKLILFSAICALPFVGQAQDISLSENYKTNKEKRLAKFKPLQTGDLLVNAGFSSVRSGYGLLFNGGAEYMLTPKMGLRANLSSNNCKNISACWRYQFWLCSGNLSAYLYLSNQGLKSLSLAFIQIIVCGFDSQSSSVWYASGVSQGELRSGY